MYSFCVPLFPLMWTIYEVGLDNDDSASANENGVSSIVIYWNVDEDHM
jgi:hypothetical protein